MKKEDAINAIYQGNLVECTKDEYDESLRTAIQTQAGKWIDDGNHVRSIIALLEIKRLDEKFQSNG